MKLYIPTSSRNFNCLFSEESISPKSFYGERGFGYSKWHSIPENPYENLIVLYDGLKYFERPNEGFDDYPLVIEVSLDDKEVEELFFRDSSGAYLYDGTLYFNPMTTGFVFFSEQQKDIVLSKAEGSLETKLVRIYNKKIRVDRAGGHYVAPQVPDAELNRLELEKSVRINKVKGFIYGYHIGNLLSVSKEQGFRVKTTQTLLDLASAIFGSIDKRPTPQQTLLLRRTILQDSSLARLLIAKTYLDADSVSSIVDEVFNQCRWEPASNSPDRSILNLYSMILNPSSQEQAISYLTSEINRILSSANAQISPEKAMDISVLSNNAIELPVLAGSPEDKAVAELWVNGELADNKYKGSLASYRLELATELTKSVRDNVYKDAWENSFAKPYLNALRRNLNGEEFTEKWNEDVLSAISAVLMKGDTWDGLRLFLISKGIQNQTTPFAFYGIINGFANLPKDFTNILLNSRDSKTLWGLLNSAVYEAINGFGMKAIAEIPTQPQKKTKGIGGLFKGAVESVAGVFSAKNDNDMAGKEESPIAQAEALANLDEMDDLPPDDLPVSIQQASSLEEDMPDFEKGKEISIPETVVSPASVLEEQTSKEQSLEGHPYTELWDKVLLIIEEETPKKKEVQEYKSTYPAAVNRVFEKKNTLVAIRNGIESIPASCATSAWNKAKVKIKKLIKQKEDDEYSVFRMANPTVIESLQCTKNLSPVVIKRLNDCWDYTGKQETDVREHIRFFLSLSKKEGRGDLSYSHTLKDVFVGRLAEQVEKELYQYFGIKG